jgi:hypothetical protein
MITRDNRNEENTIERVRTLSAQLIPRSWTLVPPMFDFDVMHRMFRRILEIPQHISNFLHTSLTITPYHLHDHTTVFTRSFHHHVAIRRTPEASSNIPELLSAVYINCSTFALKLSSSEQQDTHKATYANNPQLYPPPSKSTQPNQQDDFHNNSSLPPNSSNNVSLPTLHPGVLSSLPSARRLRAPVSPHRACSADLLTEVRCEGAQRQL